MARERDPLSVAYDDTAALLLRRAIKARPGYYETWVRSPGREFSRSARVGEKGRVDPRTRHERALTRALYYIVVQVPRRKGVDQEWSLSLKWGKIENRGGRYGRRVQLKMVTAKSGYNYIGRHPSAGLKPTGTGY